MCPASLPKPGTTVDVVGVGPAKVLRSQPAVQSPLYGSNSAQPLPVGLDAGCTLQVQYADGTIDVISAAEAPRSAAAELTEYLAIPAYMAGIFLLEGYDETSEYDEMKERLEEELSNHDLPKADAARLAEWSDEYWGGSSESDAGDQSVRVRLNFEKDGLITGRGRDGVDGSYKITSGRWTIRNDGKLDMIWEERYDEGFRVICAGTYDTASGKIDARLASNRNVSGSFTLAKKPKIF